MRHESSIVSPVFTLIEQDKLEQKRKLAAEEMAPQLAEAMEGVREAMQVQVETRESIRGAVLSGLKVTKKKKRKISSVSAAAPTVMTEDHTGNAAS